MLFLELFQWWYGAGWREVVSGALGLAKKVQLTFSVSVLLRTLFAPWRQIVTPAGRSMDEKMHAMMDNLVSRAVGFCVRLFSLFTALILILFAAIAGGVLVLLWPLVPLIIVACFWKALV